MTRNARPSALAVLAVALLSLIAPAFDVMRCRCGEVAPRPAARSCCERRDARRSSHPCASRPGGCCCVRAHDAIPAGDSAVSLPASALVFTFVASEFATPLVAPQSPLCPLGRARCRDAPDLFVLSTLRL
jgi:hypothetical protein